MKTIQAKRVENGGDVYAKLTLIDNRRNVEGERSTKIDYKNHESIKDKVREFAKFHGLKRYNVEWL